MFRKCVTRFSAVVLASVSSGVFGAELYCKASGSQAIIAKVSGDVELGSHYFGSMSDCRKALDSASFYVVCTGNSQGEAIPTRISDGEKIGQYYYSSVSSCAKATQSSFNNLVCTTDSGYGHTIITRISDERNIGEVASLNFDHCQDGILSSTRTKVCVFNNYGNYAPASIETGEILGSYSDLRGCAARL